MHAKFFHVLCVKAYVAQRGGALQNGGGGTFLRDQVEEQGHHNFGGCDLHGERGRDRFESSNQCMQECRRPSEVEASGPLQGMSSNLKRGMFAVDLATADDDFQ